MENRSKLITGENNFLFYNDDRLFINSALGCLSKCDYCYLDEIGLTTGGISSTIDAESIINEIDLNAKDLWNPDKTIAAFGCYSDPWGNVSRDKTLKIIRYLDSKNYKITVSTKQFISSSHLENIKDINNKNIWFLISLPLPNEISSREKGTSSLRMRVESIRTVRHYGFNSALYIKPYISGMAHNNLKAIIKIIHEFQLPVILGRPFGGDNANPGKKAVVSNTAELYEVDDEDYYRVKDQLLTLTTVYENSYEVFNNG